MGARWRIDDEAMRQRDGGMKRSLNIDLPSLALGGLAAAAIAMTMSAAQVRHTPAAPQMSGPNSALAGGFQARPAARDLVYLRDGDVFTVPAGRILVIGSVGTTDASNVRRNLRFSIDGVLADIYGGVMGPELIRSLSTGRPVPENSTASITSVFLPTDFPMAFLTGYLEDA